MEKLDVADYTKAVDELLVFLKSEAVFKQPAEFVFKCMSREEREKIPADKNPLGCLCLSDVYDCFGRQCVDVIQEGGGIHGIALAGFTYVLEKMGVAFTKMAGTSAGAINTMLISCSLTNFEFEAMREYRLNEQNQWKQQDNASPNTHKNAADHQPSPLAEDTNYRVFRVNTAYFSTRSEKMLDALANKDISSIIDGHPSWRQFLLGLFKGKVDFKPVKKLKNKYRNLVIATGFFLLAFLGTSLYLALNQEAPDVFNYINLGLALSFLLSFCGLVAGGFRARKFWFLSEHLGVNPGKEIEDWMTDLLKKNGIFTVHSLREKLNLETKVLAPWYNARCGHDRIGNVQNPDGKSGSKELSEEDKCTAKYKVVLAGDNGHEQDEADEEADFEMKVRLLEKVMKPCEEHPEKAKPATVNRIWDRLIRLATDLPVGCVKADLVAEARAERLLPLFEKAVELQDKTCDYSPNAKGEFETGPYNRELTVVSTDITNEMKVEFPAMHKMYWGDNLQVSPACYVRASMAIPFFFTPFEVENADGQVQVREAEWQKFMKVVKRKGRLGKNAKDSTLFVDGGALSNFPINIYATPEMPMPRKPTIGIKLEFEDESIANTISTEAGEIGSIISTMRYFYDRDFLAKNDMFKRTVRSIDTGEVHWLNFALTERDKLELFVRGAISAALFLIHTHPDIKEKRGYWINKVKSVGQEVPCEKKVSGKKKGEEKTINIYKDGDASNFRHEDLENNAVHFNWQAYKKERILGVSRIKYQRDQLKKFPE